MCGCAALSCRVRICGRRSASSSRFRGRLFRPFEWSSFHKRYCGIAFLKTLPVCFFFLPLDKPGLRQLNVMSTNGEQLDDLRISDITPSLLANRGSFFGPC